MAKFRTGNGHISDMPTLEQFTEHLRYALNNLHDPSRLVRSPLAAWFGLVGRADTFVSLQRILNNAIESMEPDDNEPVHFHAWRIYEALFYRYSEGGTPEEVASQLGISTRHLRRELQVAIEVLARNLWHDHNLARLEEEEGTSPQSTAVGEKEEPLLEDGLAWLRDQPLETRTDVGQTLADVLSLAQPLADRHGTSLRSQLPEMLPGLPIHRVALNQVLLNLLSVAIHLSPGGYVQVSVEANGSLASISVNGYTSRAIERTLSSKDSSNIDIAHRLVQLAKGRLEVIDATNRFTAVLTLPCAEQVQVLLIDDNDDARQLVERYLVGTRFSVIGTTDAHGALGLVKEYHPGAILLDVMMPEMDGWHVLGLLKEHPITSHIPLVVYTILPQEDLALALGAQAFVQKPVSREDLLKVLEAVMTNQ